MKSEVDVEASISKVLRWGVLMALLFLIVGMIWQIATAERIAIESYSQYTPTPPFEVWNQLSGSGLTSQSFLYLGLITLLLLPLLRVILTAILFYWRREWMMALAATFVTVALIVGFALGWTHP